MIKYLQPTFHNVLSLTLCMSGGMSRIWRVEGLGSLYWLMVERWFHVLAVLTLKSRAASPLQLCDSLEGNLVHWPKLCSVPVRKVHIERVRRREQETMSHMCYTDQTCEYLCVIMGLEFVNIVFVGNYD